ncbi:hypothetical protein Tfer_1630 [Thermincola ferriacetica]|uniref:Uncharacterized protein n=1 Tax=Thermincola ferriacetica TaxID=281456 RepID=A0A0L6W240_9FIRM|nr:hypothetical protein [Thermincola ferriacetica]KNZ69610.1 hypothetical protein Tfer_1630 [Thermincola ferriacetica]
MSLLMNALKQHHLTEMYLSLPVEHKKAWQQYFPKICNCSDCSSGTNKPFPIKSTARFLWVTAANAIPHRNYDFAEILLNKALEYADNGDDILWIHANFVQLYYDQIDSKREASEKCLHHCEELTKMGYLNRWVDRILNEISEV